MKEVQRRRKSRHPPVPYPEFFEIEFGDSRVAWFSESVHPQCTSTAHDEGHATMAAPEPSAYQGMARGRSSRGARHQGWLTKSHS